MITIDLSPPASSLIESIRSIGYSFDSAIADIIDNSISAESKNVSVDITSSFGEVHVTISDDGYGMSQEKLRMAMSLGGRGPSSERSENDLGRFGLGLKTASFSQATVLNVITKTSDANELNGIEWDLDHVIRTNKWEAIVLTHQECTERLLKKNINGFEHGTVVTWSNCDRVIQGIKNDEDLTLHVNRLIENLNNKLSLVYHKYLDKKYLAITINSNKIVAMDPFCIKPSSDAACSTLLFEQSFPIENTSVVIRAYLLPHISRMGGVSREKKISIDCDHTAAQGLYLYRLDRLISSGGWQNLVRKSEANKLARVEVSFNNDADHLWQLDIKKSTALLPVEIRVRLRDLIRNISSKSRDVFSSRTKMRKTNPNSIWERLYDKESKTVSYQIDRHHPIIESLILDFGSKAELAEDLLFFIESTFPTDLIANDLITNDTCLQEKNETLALKISELADIVSAAGQPFEIFKKTIFGCGLFGSDLDALDAIVNKTKGKFQL